MHEGSEILLGEDPGNSSLRGRKREWRQRQQRLTERGRERRCSHGSQERRRYQEEQLIMPQTQRGLVKSGAQRYFTQNLTHWISHKEVSIDCGKSLRNLCKCISLALKIHIILKKSFFKIKAISKTRSEMHETHILP